MDENSNKINNETKEWTICEITNDSFEDLCDYDL